MQKNKNKINEIVIKLIESKLINQINEMQLIDEMDNAKFNDFTTKLLNLEEK